MKITTRVEAHKMKQLQEIMAGHSFHWMFNPYPILQSKPEGKWLVGIDYGNASADEIYRFELLWRTLGMPIVETVRKKPIIRKFKILIGQFFNNMGISEPN